MTTSPTLQSKNIVESAYYGLVWPPRIEQLNKNICENDSQVMYVTQNLVYKANHQDFATLGDPW